MTPDPRQVRPAAILATTAAATAALLAGPWPGSLAALPVGAAAGVAAWRLWGDRTAWAAAFIAAVSASALGLAPVPAALLSAALVAAAWRPRWGPAALGAACLALKPLSLGVAALAVGFALALLPPRLAVPRQGMPEMAVRGLLWAAVAGLLLASFAVPGWLSTGPGPAVGIAALAAVAWGSASAAVVAWRAQDGGRAAWSLAVLVPMPFAAGAVLHTPVAPAIAFLVAAGAVQAPVLLRLAGAGMRKKAGVAASVVLGLGWGLAVAMLGWR